jgi:membrane-associated phospholipid phosphatase
LCPSPREQFSPDKNFVAGCPLGVCKGISALLLRWLCTFVAVSAACVLCIVYVDRPVASWAAGFDHIPRPALVNYPWLTLAFMLVILVIALRTGGGRGISHFSQTLVFAGVALAWGICMTEFVLKPLFGRQPPYEWVAHGTYSFTWLFRTDNGTFPSGHAVQMAAVGTVFWYAYPGWRWLCVGAPVLLSAVFVLGNWHFVSDVIAGLFVGLTAGLIVQALWEKTSVFARPGSQDL